MPYNRRVVILLLFIILLLYYYIILYLLSTLLNKGRHFKCTSNSNLHTKYAYIHMVEEGITCIFY